MSKLGRRQNFHVEGGKSTKVGTHRQLKAWTRDRESFYRRMSWWVQMPVHLHRLVEGVGLWIPQMPRQIDMHRRQVAAKLDDFMCKSTAQDSPQKVLSQK